MKYALVLLMTIVMSGPVAFAAESKASLPQILDQQRGIRLALDAGTLGSLTPRQVNAIRRAQSEVFALTEGKTSLDALSLDQKIQLENALERINAEMGGTRLATEAQDTCWRERKTGSSTKVTRCATQAERDSLRQDARAYMERPRVCAGGECGATP
jgi:hypothetical protein